jgi:hypothetical protein
MVIRINGDEVWQFNSEDSFLNFIVTDGPFIISRDDITGETKLEKAALGLTQEEVNELAQCSCARLY